MPQLRWTALVFGIASAAACGAASAEAGIVIDAQPASNLMPPGTKQIRLEFRVRPGAGDCRISVNQRQEFQAMTPATRLATDEGLAFMAEVVGLDPNPASVNEVFVKCSEAPGEESRLLYRALPAALPVKQSVRLARAGTVAGDVPPPADLAFGATRRTPGQISLFGVPLAAGDGLPEDHYLHDTLGRRIAFSPSEEPGVWRLNLTHPEVAAVVARNAYEGMVSSGMLYDGCYFDGAPPRMSIGRDGKRVMPDADADGHADFTELLDLAWSRGLYRAVELWRKQMPHAYAVADGTLLPTPAESAAAGALGVVLHTGGITGGQEAFESAWSRFARAKAASLEPDLCVVAATPPAQIASGYGEKPLEQAPPATIDFARASYRPMRFGLGLALLGGCAFQFDLGQAGRAARWWYDEYSFDLGAPLGPPEQVTVPGANPPNRIPNSGFENPFADDWALFTDGAAGVLAFADRDADAAEGHWSARITILNAAQSVPWHVNLYQTGLPLRGGRSYDLEFWAKADAPRPIGLAVQKSEPDFRNYGLWEPVVELSADWRRYRMTFVALESAADAQLQFLVGQRAGRVWLDGVRLAERPPDVLSRRFSQGLAVVNASPDPQTIAVDGGYRRFTATQAPRVDTILDDTDARFGSAEWKALRLDSGEWEALGPFYHQWGLGLRQSEDPAATAEWTVAGEEGAYRFSAWWPSAPYRENWTGAAVFDLLNDGVIVASKTVDQSTGGDRWEPLFEVPLVGARQYQLRLHNRGNGILTADAVRVTSAAPLHDGAPAATVTVPAFDSILLQK